MQPIAFPFPTWLDAMQTVGHPWCWLELEPGELNGLNVCLNCAWVCFLEQVLVGTVHGFVFWSKCHRLARLLFHWRTTIA